MVPKGLAVHCRNGSKHLYKCEKQCIAEHPGQQLELQIEGRHRERSRDRKGSDRRRVNRHRGSSRDFSTVLKV